MTNTLNKGGIPPAEALDLKEMLEAKAGQTVMTPAGAPHSLIAPERLKMLPIMIRETGEKEDGR